jgi:TetR/AcrR family transcriptional repressor of mexCD-oprJ operon
MKEPGARLRTPAAILETAASVLAERGDAHMNDIAAAAGVGRATLYRHFPTREALLEALMAEALERFIARVADAGLDRVPVPEAIERLLRAAFSVGDCYVVLASGRLRLLAPHLDEQSKHRASEPIKALMRRGIDDGTLRDDLRPEELVLLFGGLLVAAQDAGLSRTVGVEQAADIIASMFLNGARRAVADMR